MDMITSNLSDLLDHIDGPTEVVISETSEQNEIEKLETQLVELSRQHTHHSTKLKHWMAQDILREPIPDYPMDGIEVMKWIVIFDALFLFIRLVFMIDIVVVFALFNLISLILLVVGYKCAAHFFFWPFALCCLYETEVAEIQVVHICSIFFQSKLSLAKDLDFLFTPVLFEQMTDSFNTLKIFFYVVWKAIVFEGLLIVVSGLGCGLAMKKYCVAKEDKCLAEIDSKKIDIDRQLKLLRAKKSNCPIDS